MRVPENDVAELVEQLVASTELRKAGRCRRRINRLPKGERVLLLWKFNDWDYYDNCKVALPIRLRGLFTYEDREIIVRGYDKFFNVDETASTKRAALNTLEGPFEVTMKENGCIIFIGGMADGQLVVTSKNLTGINDDGTPLDKNHAGAGEAQLRSQLGNNAERIRELALYLYENNLTAVAEYCDDLFEEHVLPYSKDEAGLYLHGLNRNTRVFATEPMTVVKQWADTWGFRCIEWLEYSTVDELFAFLDECAKTGTYNGKEVEGFVIRGFKEGHNFFFKYKFAEPYLLYRQFREVTKKLISSGDPATVPVKVHKEITKRYLAFAHDVFQREPERKQRFLDGFGIISLRQRFLDAQNDTGMGLIEHLEQLTVEDGEELPPKYVIVPVATIGVGKTTVFHIISKLMGWPHIQNDNIGSSLKKKMVDRALDALKTSQVVLTDRNNSLALERGQIFDHLAAKKAKYLPANQPVKVIGVDFVGPLDDETTAKLWEITWSRVVARGDNHQLLKADKDPVTVERVMRSFIGRYQPVNTGADPDNQFDTVISLPLAPELSIANATTVLTSLHKLYPSIVPQIPLDTEIAEAYDDARAQKVTMEKLMALKQLVTYYGIDIDRDAVVAAIGPVLLQLTAWTQFVADGRIQPEFHVTLGHQALARTDETKARWKQLQTRLPAKYAHLPRTPCDLYATVTLESVVASPRVICITVSLSGWTNAAAIPQDPVQALNPILHITIGTANDKIRPFELNQVLAMRGSDPEIEVYPLDPPLVLGSQRVFASFV